MNAEAIPFEYRYELYGWRRLWARLRRRPWAWAFHGMVKMGAPVHINGAVSVPFTFVSPLSKEESRGWR